MVAFPFQNAIHPVDPNTFRALIARYGDLARSCLFMVRIMPKFGTRAVESLMYLCESAEIPGRAFETQEVRTYGSTYRRPFISAYSDVTLTFICTGEMLEKNFFDNWMQAINPTDYYDFNYADTYLSKIDVFQYSSAGQQVNGNTLRCTYQMTFMDAFPVTINPMPTSWAEDGVHRLQVQFSCSQVVRPYDPIKGSTQTNTIIQGGNIQNSGNIFRPVI
jgi:hypothetical protein